MLKVKRTIGTMLTLFLTFSMFVVGASSASAAADPGLGTDPGNGAIVSSDIHVNQVSIQADAIPAVKSIRAQMYDDPEMVFDGKPLKQVVADAGLTRSQYINNISWDNALERAALQRAYEQHLKWGHVRPDNSSYDSAAVDGMRWSAEIITTQKDITTAISDVKNGSWAKERDLMILYNGAFNNETGHLYILINPNYKKYGFGQVAGMTVGWAHPTGLGNTNGTRLNGNYTFKTSTTSTILNQMNLTMSIPSNMKFGQSKKASLTGTSITRWVTPVPVSVEAKYTSSNPNVVSITPDGSYKAIGNGTAKITAKTSTGKTYTSDVTVTGAPIPEPGVITLSNNWNTLTNDIKFEFGKPGDEVIVGDWDGDGVDTLGIRSGNTFSLYNTHNPGKPDLEFKFGRVGDEVMIGDWDGNGTDTLGVRRGADKFYLNDKLQGGNAEHEFNYGRKGDEIVVGNWNGSNNDTISVRRGKTFYIMNTLRGGNADVEYIYGRLGDEVLAGDFDGDGQDTITLRRGNTLYINNKHKGGNAEREVVYGNTGEPILIGDWNGDGTDTPGLFRTK